MDLEALPRPVGYFGSRTRVQEPSNESVDRLQRLGNVVRTWKSQRVRGGGGDDVQKKVSVKSANALDCLPKGAVPKVTPLLMLRENRKDLNDEIKLHMLTMGIEVQDRWEKAELKAQAVTAADLYEKQKVLNETVIKQIEDADEQLGKEARKRIETRQWLHDAHIGAQKCYKELEESRQKQKVVIKDLDAYVKQIEEETSKLKYYARVEFEEDRKKMQLLMEDQRVSEECFESLHGVEIAEMHKQKEVMQADLAKKGSRMKLLQLLRWQIRNLKYEPVTFEKELLKSDITILSSKLQNIKNDVAFMQERYHRLCLTEDLYASETELSM